MGTARPEPPGATLPGPPIMTPGPGSSSTVPPGPGTTTSWDPNGNWYMSWKAQPPRPNSAATTESAVTATTGCLRGTRTSSQAPSSEVAPSAGT